MKYSISVLFVFYTLFASAAKPEKETTIKPLSVNNPSDSVVFAIVGDYGENNENERAVANMIKTWDISFIITTGDNNYPLGSKKTIKQNIANYYGDYIYNPDAPPALKCSGRATNDKVNRFFPCPGNHDNYTPNMKPYRKFFTLPGDESNYDFVWGPVHFYSINTGTDANIDCCESTEAKWLTTTIAQSTEPFKIVYFHHPPISPGDHGSAVKMQWPFGKMGLDAVLCGHEHFYARIEDKTSPKPAYIISGNGGNKHLYGCNRHPLDARRYDVKMCDNNHWGAMKATATRDKLVLEYYGAGDATHPLDTYIIRK